MSAYFIITAHYLQLCYTLVAALCVTIQTHFRTFIFVWCIF